MMKQVTEQLHSFMLPQQVSYETCSVQEAAEGGTVAAAQAAWTEFEFSLPEAAPPACGEHRSATVLALG